VIADLDGAFTKYLEGTVESEWRGDKTFVRGSYTWTHYYGNFDQDDAALSATATLEVVAGPRMRVGEVANWIEFQVLPMRVKRGRG